MGSIGSRPKFQVYLLEQTELVQGRFCYLDSYYEHNNRGI